MPSTVSMVLFRLHSWRPLTLMCNGPLQQQHITILDNRVVRCNNIFLFTILTLILSLDRNC